MASAPFELHRFLTAQDLVYGRVLDELRAGRKTSHWMWFVFPQLRGLGKSEMATYYGLDGRAEATAYLDHPVLGARLRESTSVVNGLEGTTAERIFGTIDAMKFRSSTTLFELVGGGAEFSWALEKYFEGRRDERTVELAG